MQRKITHKYRPHSRNFIIKKYCKYLRMGEEKVPHVIMLVKNDQQFKSFYLKK